MTTKMREIFIIIIMDKNMNMIIRQFVDIIRKDTAEIGKAVTTGIQSSVNSGLKIQSTAVNMDEKNAISITHSNAMNLKIGKNVKNLHVHFFIEKMHYEMHLSLKRKIMRMPRVVLREVTQFPQMQKLFPHHTSPLHTFPLHTPPLHIFQHSNQVTASETRSLRT